MCRSYTFCSRNNTNYSVRKLKYGFIDSAQNIGYINLICAILSLICLNTTTLSSLNLLILPLTLSLVCKPDYIQNLIFHAYINFRSIHCFINTIFVLKYNIPTSPTSPVELKLFNRLPNNIISETVFLFVTFPSSDQMILNMYIYYFP